MHRNQRRHFLFGLTALLATVAATPSQAAPDVQETDAAAASLGYRADTTKVDAAKYPKHTKDQACASCQLFQGKPTDKVGGCPLFAGKQVAAAGWCTAWAKRA